MYKMAVIVLFAILPIAHVFGANPPLSCRVTETDFNHPPFTPQTYVVQGKPTTSPLGPLVSLSGSSKFLKGFEYSVGYPTVGPDIEPDQIFAEIRKENVSSTAYGNRMAVIVTKAPFAMMRLDCSVGN